MSPSYFPSHSLLLVSVVCCADGLFLVFLWTRVILTAAQIVLKNESSVYLITSC